MRNRLLLLVRALLCALVCVGSVGVASLATSGCSQEAIQKAEDPATLQQLSDGVVLREELCRSLPALAAYVPTEALAKARAGCATGDTFQDIAAALGGCYATRARGSGPAEEARPVEDVQPNAPAPAPDGEDVQPEAGDVQPGGA